MAARVENIRPVRPPAGEETIFVLHVASPEGTAFDGPDVHAALDAEGLKFGLNDFYHRVTDDNGEIESVYSVASMVKPGVLDPVDQDHLRTPGLTLFLILPGAIEGLRAMRDMMETANALAKRLGGQVLDDQRNRLKAQSAQYILDQIAELDRQARLRKAR
ncbi:MAG: cell division protein ZipA [Luteimonas sp.]|nr:cell division protein ZipA [Luteimonas sp.]